MIRYIEDTYEAASDAIHPYYNSISIRFNTMQFDALEK